MVEAVCGADGGEVGGLVFAGVCGGPCGLVCGTEAGLVGRCDVAVPVEKGNGKAGGMVGGSQRGA